MPEILPDQLEMLEFWGETYEFVATTRSVCDLRNKATEERFRELGLDFHEGKKVLDHGVKLQKIDDIPGKKFRDIQEELIAQESRLAFEANGKNPDYYWLRILAPGLLVSGEYLHKDGQEISRCSIVSVKKASVREIVFDLPRIDFKDWGRDRVDMIQEADEKHSLKQRKLPGSELRLMLEFLSLARTRISQELYSETPAIS